jgi:hypothetical protein
MASQIGPAPVHESRQCSSLPNRLTAAVIAMLLLGYPGEVRCASTENEAAFGIPYRCLFVVETSSAMEKALPTAADTISKLLLTGVGGRLRAGDRVGVWTYGSRLDNQSFPVFVWSPAQMLDISNFIYRRLRDQKASGSSAAFDRAVTGIKIAIQASEQTLVFLVCSGTDPVIGTAQDEAINSIFANHGEGMRKAGKPFIVVMVAERGAIVAHSVTPGDRLPFIPNLPKTPAEPAVTNASKVRIGQPLIITNPAPATPTTNRAKGLSVEEISAQLRQQASQPALPSTDNSDASTEPRDASAPGLSLAEADDDAWRTPAEAAASESSPQLVPAAPPRSAERGPLTSATPVERDRPQSPSPDGGVAAAPASPTPLRSPAAATTAAPEVIPAPAVLVPPAPTLPPVRSPWLDVLNGCALVAAALALGVILWRNRRVRHRASLITQSFDQTHSPH